MNKTKFDEALVRALPRLRRMVRSMTKDHRIAEDVVQDTIVNALTAWTQFKVRRELEGDLAAWLFTTARNKWRSQWRRSGRMIPVDDVTLELMSEHQPADQLSNIFVQEISAEIDKLPRNMRRMVWHAIEGRSTAESAALLNIPEGTVKSRLHRAREKLAQALGNPELTRILSRISRRYLPATALDSKGQIDGAQFHRINDLKAWGRLGRHGANKDASDASNAYPPVVPYQAPPPIDCGCIPRIPRSTLYAEHPQETDLPPMPGASGET